MPHILRTVLIPQILLVSNLKNSFTKQIIGLKDVSFAFMTGELLKLDVWEFYTNIKYPTLIIIFLILSGCFAQLVFRMAENYYQCVYPNTKPLNRSYARFLSHLKYTFI